MTDQMQGVLPDHALEAMIAAGQIRCAAPDADQVQPASLDLRLGSVAYRVRASFLAGQGRPVADRIANSRCTGWT
jgi:dCTP deaminase